jgi:hypothetical protein
MAKRCGYGAAREHDLPVLVGFCGHSARRRKVKRHVCAGEDRLHRLHGEQVTVVDLGSEILHRHGLLAWDGCRCQ